MKFKDFLTLVDDDEYLNVYHKTTENIEYLMTEIEKKNYDNKYDNCEIINVAATFYGTLDIEINL